LQFAYKLRESAEAILALPLRVVQSLVRGCDELHRRQRVFRERGHADAERQVVPWRGGQRSRSRGLDDAVRQAAGSGGVGVGDHDRQLVTTVTGDDIIGSRACAHDLDACLKNEVSVLVTGLIVHRLEVIEVDEQERKWTYTPIRAGECGFEPAPELPYVV
jgi:hypothetical protein